MLRIENLSEANGQPVSIMTAWYPQARFAGLLPEGWRAGDPLPAPFDERSATAEGS